MFLPDRGIAALPHFFGKCRTFISPRPQWRKGGKQEKKPRRCGCFLSGTLFTLSESFTSQICQAFCKVSHRRLLSKLQYYGIQGPLLNWFESFLTQRFQSVVCEGQTSSQCPVTSGVPQGTVLGPLLFLLYINDLPDNVQSSVRLFADDALLYGIVASDAVCDLLQSDLSRLESWQFHWQMEFNPSKCKIVTISHKNNPPESKYV